MKILIINEKPAEYGQRAVRNGEMPEGGTWPVWEHSLLQSVAQRWKVNTGDCCRFRHASFALSPKRKELISFLLLPGMFPPGRGGYASGLLCILLWRLSVLFPTSLLVAGFFPCTVLVSTGARIWTGQSTKMHSFLNCYYHSHNYQSVAMPLPRSIYGINTLSKAQWFIHSPQR